VAEVGPVQDGQVTVTPIFEYQLEGYDSEGHAVGRFVGSRVRPKFYQTLRLAAGARVDELLAADA
jgi:hypothetical protein